MPASPELICQKPPASVPMAGVRQQTQEVFMTFNLDLSEVLRRVCAETGWSDAVARAAEAQYRAFLERARTCPEVLVPLSDDAAKLWAAHAAAARE